MQPLLESVYCVVHAKKYSERSKVRQFGVGEVVLGLLYKLCKKNAKALQSCTAWHPALAGYKNICNILSCLSNRNSELASLQFKCPFCSHYSAAWMPVAVLSFYFPLTFPNSYCRNQIRLAMEYLPPKSRKNPGWHTGVNEAEVNTC